MSFKKCPIDGYDMANIAITNSVFNWGDSMSIWICKSCGFVALFDLEYIKGLDKKK